jgi:hypothetical protein
MKISFLDAARSELDDAIDYYEERRSGLGFEFAEEVEQALERINHYPEAWSPLSVRVRRCVVNRFPYSVIRKSKRDHNHRCDSTSSSRARKLAIQNH